MKVLVAHNFYSSQHPSGENAVVEEDIRSLEADGHSVSRYTPSSDSIAAMALAHKFEASLGPIAYRPALREIRRLIIHDRPDVLHLHNPYPLVSPAAARLALRMEVPVVQTVHNYRHVCMSGDFFREGKICRDCTPGLPWPGVRNACYRGSRPQSAAMAIGLAANRNLWPRLSHFIALTRFQASELQRLGVPADKVSVRPTSCQDPGEPSPPGKDVLFLGRLDPNKGLTLLLRAWRLSSLGDEGRVLNIAGDGPLMAELKQSADLRDDVRLLGQVGRSQVDALFRQSGVVALPSLWFEGLPRVIAEAWAHGRGVVACRNDNLETVIDSTTGWLAERDPIALAGALRLAASAPLPVQPIRQRWSEHMSPCVALRGLLCAYNEAMRSPR